MKTNTCYDRHLDRNEIYLRVSTIIPRECTCLVALKGSHIISSRQIRALNSLTLQRRQRTETAHRVRIPSSGTFVSGEFLYSRLLAFSILHNIRRVYPSCLPQPTASFQPDALFLYVSKRDSFKVVWKLQCVHPQAH